MHHLVLLLDFPIIPLLDEQIVSSPIFFVCRPMLSICVVLASQQFFCSFLSGYAPHHRWVFGLRKSYPKPFVLFYCTSTHCSYCNCSADCSDDVIVDM